MGLPLFIYGSLEPGEVRAGLLTGLSRRPARTRGRLYRMPEGYPALQLVDSSESSWVQGVLVQAPPERVVRLLDRLEGVEEGLFERVEVQVLGALLDVRAWTWAMRAPVNRGGRRIPSGRWRGRTRR